jgi:putative PIN family toxin of toxin-antitoxin system
VPILTETAKKLREKFRWDDEHITAALKQISKIAEIVKPQSKITVLYDEPDNRVLECAVQAGAHLIVTGDRHLLQLKNHEGIGITRISGLLKTLH